MKLSIVWSYNIYPLVYHHTVPCKWDLLSLSILFGMQDLIRYEIEYICTIYGIFLFLGKRDCIVGHVWLQNDIRKIEVICLTFLLMKKNKQMNILKFIG